MKTYVIGKCKSCGNVGAAAIKHGINDWKEDIVEFVEAGYDVSKLETDERVTIDGCIDDCPEKP